MRRKKILFLLFLSFIIYAPSFSQSTDVNDTLNKTKQERSVERDLRTVLGTIVNVCGSAYVKVLATVSLLYIAIKLILSQDKRAFLKSIYGWIIACLLITSVPGIVNGVMKISDSIQSLQTYSLIDIPGFSNSKSKK